MIEREHQKQAFEQYYAMGVKRSLRKASQRFGIALNTLKLWSKEFAWGERIEERDRDVSRVMRTRTHDVEIDSQVRNRQFVQMALVTLAKQIAEGKIKGTIADLDRMIRLELFLEGKVESRHEIVSRELQGKTTAEIRAMLREEMEELADLAREGEIDAAEVNELLELPSPPAGVSLDQGTPSCAESCTGVDRLDHEAGETPSNP